MTDKQIIIDGVPVQDCCYFDYENDGYEDCCYIHQNECSAQNCYYKQLKLAEQRIVELNKTIQAKEQECEELKEENFTFENLIKEIEKYGAIEEIIQQLDQLKAENEELKKWLPITTRLVDEFENYEKIKGINYRIYTQVFFKKFNKLKQTLTEIKEIAEAHKKDESVWNPYRQLDKILQKISECEVNDEIHSK